jgi:hypothetical protein
MTDQDGNLLVDYVGEVSNDARNNWNRLAAGGERYKYYLVITYFRRKLKEGDRGQRTWSCRGSKSWYESRSPFIGSSVCYVLLCPTPYARLRLGLHTLSPKKYFRWWIGDVWRIPNFHCYKEVKIESIFIYVGGASRYWSCTSYCIRNRWRIAIEGRESSRYLSNFRLG